MTPTLPRAFLVLFFVFGMAACGHAEPPPVAPGPPIPAEPEITVGTMAAECDGLIAALERYRDCKYHDAYARDGVDRSIEAAHLSFAAGVKANPDERAQHAIALSCRKATDSIKAATERCGNGPPPRPDSGPEVR